MSPQAEPHIAINPLDSFNLVVGAVSYELGDARAFAYATFDAGFTWTKTAIPLAPIYTASGDPTVAFDGQGNAYYSGIAFFRAGGVIFENSVFVAKSTDGGLTWTPTTVLASPTNPPLHDKPWLDVDTTGGPFDGVVYVTWTRFNGGPTTTILSSTSLDGGATWLPPVDVSGFLPSNLASQVGVGPLGQVHIVWQEFGGSRHVIATSPPGGLAFSLPVTVAPVANLPSPLPGFGFRVNSFPYLDVDPAGTLHVVWGDYAAGDADVLGTMSTDGGLTWSAPILVNDDGLPGHHQFFPAVAASPLTGRLDVVFYDTREDPAIEHLDVWAATAPIATMGFGANQDLTAVSSDPDVWPTFIGDYIGISPWQTITACCVMAAWTDTRNGLPGDLNEDVFVAAFA